MTDKEKLIALLNEWGVEFRTATAEDQTLGYAMRLEVESGYGGFYTEFTFTADGKFVSMGAYE